VKEIPLTQGQVALVDNEDFETLNQFKWCAQWAPDAQTFYAQRREGKKIIYMHRKILDAPDRVKIDHRNHLGLDNQRSNLRFATGNQNQANSRISKRNTSGFKGVSRYRKKERWKAQISKNNRSIFLGYFNHPEQAARAYDAAALKYFGEFACCNFPN